MTSATAPASAAGTVLLQRRFTRLFTGLLAGLFAGLLVWPFTCPLASLL
jgi:hypothetical protein